MKGLLGKKIGMTQIFDENGAAVANALAQAATLGALREGSEDVAAMVEVQPGLHVFAHEWELYRLDASGVTPIPIECSFHLANS